MSTRNSVRLFSLARPSRKRLLFAALLLVIVVPSALLLAIHRAPPTTQIVLFSPPVRSPDLMVHYRPNFNWSENTYITQSCHIAEVQLKNLGPGSIVLPNRGGMSLEFQEPGSTNWVPVYKWTLGIMYKPIPAGETLNFKVRIPDTAARWRVNTSYSRWFLPQQLLNYVLRDWLHLNFEVGDRKEYSVESEIWQLAPPASS